MKNKNKELKRLLSNFDFETTQKVMKLTKHEWLINKELKFPSIQQMKAVVALLYENLKHSRNHSLQSHGFYLSKEINLDGKYFNLEFRICQADSLE